MTLPAPDCCPDCVVWAWTADARNAVVVSAAELVGGVFVQDATLYLRPALDFADDCLTGPVRMALAECMERFDYDRDGDVDLRDVCELQRRTQ